MSPMAMTSGWCQLKGSSGNLGKKLLLQALENQQEITKLALFSDARNSLGICHATVSDWHFRYCRGSQTGKLLS